MQRQAAVLACTPAPALQFGTAALILLHATLDPATLLQVAAALLPVRTIQGGALILTACLARYPREGTQK